MDIKKILAALMTFFLVLTPGFAFAEPANTTDQIIATKDFSQNLLSDDTLLSMAKNGILVNDDCTKVEVLPSPTDEYLVKILLSWSAQLVKLATDGTQMVLQPLRTEPAPIRLILQLVEQDTIQILVSRFTWNLATPG